MILYMEDKEFKAHGYRCLNNYGGNEIEISDSGDAARIKWQSGQITDWLEIQIDDNGNMFVREDESDEPEYLNNYMRY